MATAISEESDRLVTCQNSQGMKMRANLSRLGWQVAVFEVCNPALVLRMSEVLSDFKIVINDHAVYSGRAVVKSFVNTGAGTVCEVRLDESGLSAELLNHDRSLDPSLGKRFNNFLGQWQKHYRILPEFKVVMAELQGFFADLRLWLDQVELEIRSAEAIARDRLERVAVDELAGPIIRVIDTFIDRFETIAAGLPPELESAHRMHLRRQLHPLLLCSPFAHRTYHKPLGYAGDYGMVAMMLRPPYEGGSLFAKIINVWFLAQAPAEAHRNRVAYLTRKLVEEAVRVRAGGQMFRVFNLGCGPADEVQRFLREEHISERAQLTLVDFNEETLQHLREKLAEIKLRHGRNTTIQIVKKSVHQMLKEGGKPAGRQPDQQYDLVYCAGLFDYLSNQVCQRLMNIFYEMVAPGGLLLATNVSDAMNSVRPFRYSMEYILDWHLIYRDGRDVAALAPDLAPPDAVKVIAEDTGVNVFIEVRKPSHG